MFFAKFIHAPEIKPFINIDCLRESTFLAVVFIGAEEEADAAEAEAADAEGMM